MDFNELKKLVGYEYSLWEASSSELKKKLQELGVDPGAMSVDQMEARLAVEFWKKNRGAEEMPDQFDPMLAHDATKKGPDFLKNVSKRSHFIQTKKNGMRSVFKITPTMHQMTARARAVGDFLFTAHHEKVLGFIGVKCPFKGKTVFDGELMPPAARIDTGDTVTTTTLQAVVALVHMETERSLALQRKIGSLHYDAFDILWFDGEDVTNKPYEERVNILAAAAKMLLEANPNLPFSVVPVIDDYDSVEAIFDAHVAGGEEGVMLKSRKGLYRQGKRSSDILKLKREFTVDGWISGATLASEDKGNANFIGGFTLSAFVDGKARRIASITGIDMKIRRDATVLVDGKPTLNPSYLNRVVQVTGQQFNRNGLLDHARFDEWRPDKDPSQCQLQSKDMGIPTTA